MRLCNSKWKDLADNIGEKPIVIFGVGDYWNLYGIEKFPQGLVDHIIYAVDNRVASEWIQVGNKEIPIYLPEVLLKEKNCAIMLMSSNFMYEMYLQISEMHLKDDIDCYAFPLILAESEGEKDSLAKKLIFNTQNEEQIPKIIHSFWFSGDKKPEAYQKCIDSWRKKCPDYKIVEWDMNNYNYRKNQFMKAAIEKKKWAFASDYARLDVIYQFGGIYMDMDVELLQSFDSLLGNDAFFTFDTQNDIDLGTFGAKKECGIVADMMRLYEGVEFSDDIKRMNYLCQPRYIRSVMRGG